MRRLTITELDDHTFVLKVAWECVNSENPHSWEFYTKSAADYETLEKEVKELFGE